MRSLWTAVLDFLYPPKCPVCREPIAKHGEWCLACLAKVLAVRAIHPAAHRLRHLDSCQILCDYHSGAKKLIQAIKFHGNLNYIPHLNWLLHRYSNLEKIVQIDVVIPIPLHCDRLKERGYNQTEKIFQEWAAAKKLLWVNDALTRSRPTAPLWNLPLQERRRTIKDSFQIMSPQTVAGKVILLVDDIFTSGTTMDECAKVLKRAGANSVHGLAIASGAD
ncbi:ComF family protein [bacterium BFN5]|nr:ComF family protein [bacterium BFN5]QJW47358.1 ComF family protein [bacterium BFN5]